MDNIEKERDILKSRQQHVEVLRNHERRQHRCNPLLEKAIECLAELDLNGVRLASGPFVKCLFDPTIDARKLDKE